MKMKMFTLVWALSTLFTACSKDEKNDPGSTDISVESVRNTVVSGSWRITYFWDTDHDETSHFTDYHFTFFGTGLLMAVKGNDHIHGGWSTGTDNSKVKLILDFPSPAIFEDLNEDWQVIERTDSRVKLQHESGGYGGTDYLTFEKD